MAVFQAARFFPRTFGPLLAGVAADTIGFRAMFTVAAACGFVAFCLTLRIRDPAEWRTKGEG